ncbi:hypothetical protein MSG28_001804 [Choristoneura fumiferana]|uniref:Uncharacterized protein n=1 Tax=Choristoneura fumiferana TaxID=7141 RepID=A0ACC0KW87_CHOFU|nr:hypothetical protein MSG28_001804 [Choristoneura fumiferana]
MRDNLEKVRYLRGAGFEKLQKALAAQDGRRSPLAPPSPSVTSLAKYSFSVVRPHPPSPTSPSDDAEIVIGRDDALAERDARRIQDKWRDILLGEHDWPGHQYQYDIIVLDQKDFNGLKPWSSKLVANLDNAIVLDDLTSLQYQMRSKDIKFDVQHALEALRTLARFHAGSIIYEETVTKNLNKPYRLGEEYGQYLDLAHFDKANQWFIQCKTGALMVVKEYSKYKNADKDLLKIIEDRWSDVWNAALDYNDSERSVICHRDLWNNNLLFHYKKREDGKII